MRTVIQRVKQASVTGQIISHTKFNKTLLMLKFN